MERISAATTLQRILRGYMCRRKHIGQQLCNRISELYIEMDETMSNYNGISRILEDLRFLEREIEAHGPFSAYGVQVPSSIPEWLVTRRSSTDDIRNFVWLTGVLIPAYKERAENRVENQNAMIEWYENKEGPLVPAAPGLDKYSLSDYYYEKMLETLHLLKPYIVPGLGELSAIGFEEVLPPFPIRCPPLPGQTPAIYSMAPEVQELYRQGFFTEDGELAPGVTYSLNGTTKTLYKN